MDKKKRFFTSFNEWHPTPPPNPASVVHVKSLVDYGNTKTPACTLGWVARLCCSWLSLGKANLISHWDNTVVKSDNEKKVLGLDSLISSSTCLEWPGECNSAALTSHQSSKLNCTHCSVKNSLSRTYVQGQLQLNTYFLQATLTTTWPQYKSQLTMLSLDDCKLNIAWNWKRLWVGSFSKGKHFN